MGKAVYHNTSRQQPGTDAAAADLIVFVPRLRKSS